ncbi:protein transporter SEC24 [Capsaspora owczarzaki ATCC 30864]|uniref:Protein transporter SEC24 n=1 Tax=Capsaspora owczarzaki (strain ATCC 30864) TaxID=595528 RepID=A0A0D2UHS0_CAPO3|nr:protein transporter SEC24 [Capsaspora owczarzaki ATCC 30864]KJE94626.1 protein transporter SEC24 [Capsaspora owczarzaki ATCC 30864]|eukprot:XP_004346932.2 protein transporter SEC24 [Capsaspora owczarzaki ATCC 30864]
MFHQPQQQQQQQPWQPGTGPAAPMTTFGQDPTQGAGSGGYAAQPLYAQQQPRPAAAQAFDANHGGAAAYGQPMHAPPQPQQHFAQQPMQPLMMPQQQQPQAVHAQPPPSQPTPLPSGGSTPAPIGGLPLGAPGFPEQQQLGLRTQSHVLPQQPPSSGAAWTPANATAPPTIATSMNPPPPAMSAAGPAAPAPFSGFPQQQQQHQPPQSFQQQPFQQPQQAPTAFPAQPPLQPAQPPPMQSATAVSGQAAPGPPIRSSSIPGQSTFASQPPPPQSQPAVSNSQFAPFNPNAPPQPVASQSPQPNAPFQTPGGLGGMPFQQQPQQQFQPSQPSQVLPGTALASQRSSLTGSSSTDLLQSQRSASASSFPPATLQQPGAPLSNGSAPSVPTASGNVAGWGMPQSNGNSTPGAMGDGPAPDVSQNAGPVSAAAPAKRRHYPTAGAGQAFGATNTSPPIGNAPGAFNPAGPAFPAQLPQGGFAPGAMGGPAFLPSGPDALSTGMGNMSLQQQPLQQPSQQLPFASLPTAQFGQPAPAQFGQPSAVPSAQGAAGFIQAQPQAYNPGFVGNQAPMLSNSHNLLLSKNTIPDRRPRPPHPMVPQDRVGMNCSPDVMRLTMNAIPRTANLLTKSRLPLGLHIHPFADPRSTSDGIAGVPSIPVVTSTLIIRCRTCRAYINPFVQFIDQGRKFKCNVCFRINDMPSEFDYQQNPDGSSTYLDRATRPELTAGSIEYIAPSEYMVRAPQPAVYLFLIDVSFAAVQNGMVASASRTLLQHLDQLHGDARLRVGIITYDSTVHFYNLQSSRSQPQMLVVSDLEEMFLPSPDDLLVTLAESRELVVSLLTKLPTMFQNTQNAVSALPAALTAAYQLLSPTGGRVTVLQSTLPSTGPNALQVRDDAASRGTPKEIANLQPADEFYKKYAVDCSRQQIGIDTFLFSSSYIDVATIGSLSRHSSGSCYFYPGFHAARNPDMNTKFISEFARNLTRPLGLEAVIRVRCTQGLTPHSFHGNFFLRQTDLLALPTVNPDHGFGMQISLEESFTNISQVVFQTALLYTTTSGERRIRVHTLVVPVVGSIGELYDAADCEALAGLAAKMAVNRMLTTKLSDARDGIMNMCQDILSTYKSEVLSSNAAGGSLMISPTLSLLPLYLLAALKNAALRLGKNTSNDERAYATMLIRTLPMHDLLRFLYPSMYGLHDLPTQCGVPQGQDIILPPLLPLNSERFERHGVYIIETSQLILIWVGRNVAPELCSALFDVANFSAIPAGMMSLPQLDNDYSRRVRNIVKKIRHSSVLHPLLLVVREDDMRLRPLVMSYLVEDKGEASPSYFEFLTQVAKTNS